MQTAIVLAIGAELTLGRTVDTNTSWIARRLAGAGLRVRRYCGVGDELSEISDAFAWAVQHADLVVSTGGLGPTDDDLTRAALAEAGAAPLALHEPSLARLEAFFRARGRAMPERNRVQAYIPAGSRAIDNTCGTAPGLHAILSGTPVFALPGVPFEMQAMFERDVLPFIRGSAVGRVIISRELRSYGLPEAEVNDRLGDLMARGANPEIGTSAKLGDITIRVDATAPNPATAKSMLDAVEADVRERLGTAVYGVDEDTLGSAVGKLLVEQGRTIAIAESCSGGLIGKLLTDVPGSSAYFLGSLVCYADTAKRDILGVPEAILETHGAVSEAAARAMSQAARERFGADFALSVTGIAGPGGGSEKKPIGLVYIGLASADSTMTREQRFGPDSSRDVIRERAARNALNLLRLQLLDRDRPPRASRGREPM